MNVSDERRAAMIRGESTDLNLLAACLRGYTAGFSGRHLTDHGVASPLGLWLLLALVAPAADGDARCELEDALGVDAAYAGAFAAHLLSDPHPAVAAAVAVWTRPGVGASARWEQWAAVLPGQVAQGSVPAQSDADRWVAEATRELIVKFPGVLGVDVAAVLASAVASKVTWAHPFEDAVAGDLGGPFGSGDPVVLRTPQQGHTVALADTAAAGLVGVHQARSSDGLRVVSVIAHPDVPAGDVHAAAAQVAGLETAMLDPGARWVAPEGVPSLAGATWSVSSRVRANAGGEQAVVRHGRALMPAWDANSSFDLTDEGGVGGVRETLAQMAAPGSGVDDISAQQVAVASFGKEGFEAAAVTSMILATRSLPPRQVLEVDLEVRFAHPYAVVALAGQASAVRARGAERPHQAWEHVPVFTAWVAQPRTVTR